MRLRLLDHRCAGAAVASGCARALAVDDGARARRGRRVPTDSAPGTCAALHDRTLCSRAVGGSAAGHCAATPERRTFLAEDPAVSCARGVGPHGPTDGSTAGRTSQPAYARVTSQAGPTRDGGGRCLRCRMTAQRGVATQDIDAALAADAQSSTAGSTGAGLTADSDTAERARHVRSSRTIQCGAFASDQPRLTARAST